MEHRDLSAGQAESLAARRFDVEEAQYFAPVVGPGERVVDRIGEQAAVVDSGDVNVLKMFSYPLSVPALGGGESAPDLELVDRGETFRPDAPIVPLVIREMAEEGFELGDRVSIRPATDGQTAPGNRMGEAVFFGNAAEDTDYIVKPTALGAESFWQLRSPASPERFALKFSLPEDADLRLDDSGRAAEVVKDDRVLMSVHPPSARDADGVPVPVSISVAGDILRLEAPHRQRSLRYPILVDPTYDAVRLNFAGNYNPSDPNQVGFSHLFQRNNLSNFVYNSAVPMGVGASSTAAGDYGYFYIQAPGSSQIYRADMSSAVFSAAPNKPIRFFSTITGVNPSLAAWTSPTTPPPANPLPVSLTQTFSGKGFTLCANQRAQDDSTRPGKCWPVQAVSNGNQFQVGLYSTGDSSGAYVAEAIGGASVSFGDLAAPTAPTVDVPSGWTSSNIVQMTATQSGLGIVVFQVLDPTQAIVYGDLDLNCYFDFGSPTDGRGATSTTLPPCPTNPPLKSVPVNVADGVHSLRARATSITKVADPSNVTPFTLKLDRAAPVITTKPSDSAVQASSSIQISANDALSGIASLSAKVRTPNGTLVSLYDGSCVAPADNGCSVSGDFTLPLQQHGYGRYQVTYSATDRSNPANTSSHSYNVDYARLPGAPTGVIATPGDAAANVSWTNPTDNGGSTITQYRIILRSTSGQLERTLSAGETRPVSIPNLINGRDYAVTVQAINAVGPGPESAPPVSVVPAVPPGPPTGVTAAAGDGFADVSWTPPTDNGGAAISEYRVLLRWGGQLRTESVLVGASRPVRVAGLTNGTQYSVTVKAVNAVGPSAESAPAASVTPGRVPGAPTGVTASLGNGASTVSWTPPTNSGGSAITQYRVTLDWAGGSRVETVAPAPKGAQYTQVTGLHNGRDYLVTVTAVNALGAGPPSAPPVAVTPAGPPGAPTGVTAEPGAGFADISWTPPGDNGGRSISEYQIVLVNGKTSRTVVVPAGASRPVRVTQLTNGTQYVVTVKAVTSVSAGPASAPEVNVTPGQVPGPPTSLSAAPGDTFAAISWTPPSNAGGSTITQYRIILRSGTLERVETVPASTARPVQVSGLENGREYAVTVRAVNAAGAGPESAPPVAVTPRTKPGAPREVTAIAGEGQATVNWNAPVSDGGAAITQYMIYAYVDGEAASFRSLAVAGGARSAAVTNLPLGAYRFAVSATNAAGEGAQSPKSNVVNLLDGDPPSLTVTGPLRNGPIALGRSAQASAVDRNSGVKDVRFYIKPVDTLIPDNSEPTEAQLVHTATCVSTCRDANGFTTSYALPQTYASGRYQINVRARDVAGNRSEDRWVIAVVQTRTDQDNRLGLEQWFDLDDTNSGGDSTVYVNGETGNVVWHQMPIVNPGRGLATAVNLTYNSQDRGGLLGLDLGQAPLLAATPQDTALLGTGDLTGLSYREAGVNFSLGIGGPTRVNEPLGGVLLAGATERALGSETSPWPAGPEAVVTLRDADGTLHTFRRAAGSTAWSSSAGADLQLQWTGPRASGPLALLNVADLEEDAAWELLRPDGVRHVFDSFGYLQETVDRNGNTLDYHYESYGALTGEACVGMVGQLQQALGLCVPRLTEVRQPTWSNDHPERRVKLEYTDAPENPLAPLLSSLGVNPFFAIGYVQSDAPQVDLLTDASGRTYDLDYHEQGPLKGYLERFTENSAPLTDAPSDVPRVTRFVYDEESDGEATQPRLGDAEQLTRIVPVVGGVDQSPTVIEYEARQNPAAGQPPAPRRARRLIKRGGGTAFKLYEYTSTSPRSFRVLEHVLGDRYLMRDSQLDAQGRPLEIVNATATLANDAPPSSASAIADEQSTTTHIEWNPDENKPQLVTEAAEQDAERTTTYNYLERSSGHVQSKVVSSDAETKTTTLEYEDGEGFVADLTAINLPGDRTWRYDHDPRGNVTLTTDPAGVEMESEYDAANGYVVAREQDLMKRWTTYADHDPATGQPRTVTLPSRPATDERPADPARVWRYEYDQRGDVIEVVDPRNASGDTGPDDPYVTTLDYDGFGRIVHERLPRLSEGSVAEGPRFVESRTEYDRDGAMTLSVDPRGERTSLSYTLMDKPSKITRPGSEGVEISELVYDDADRLIARSTPNAGNIDPQSVRSDHLAACSSGPIAAGAHAFLTRYCLDHRGLERAAIEYAKPGDRLRARLSTLAYDGRGNVIGANDPERNTAEQSDGSAQPLTVDAALALVQAPQRRISTTYDVLDRPTEEVENSVDGADRRRTLEYWPQGELKTVTQFDGGSSRAWNMTYDQAGHLLSRKDPLGRVTCWMRQDDGLPTRITSPRGTDGDEDTCLDTPEDIVAFTTTIDYDAAGNVMSRSIPYSSELYDPSRTDIRQWKITYKRDAIGDPVEITDARQNTITNRFYDSGDLRSTNRPSWWSADWQGVEANPTAGDRYAGADAADVQVSPNGPVIVERAGASANALGGDERPGKPESLGKTDFGAPQTAELPGLLPDAGETQFSYDEEMRLTGVTDTDGTKREIGYDPAGRVAFKRWPLEQGRTIQHDFSYDPSGNLTEVVEDWRGEGTGEERVRTDFDYDGFNRRIAEIAPGAQDEADLGTPVPTETTEFIYDANDNLVERVTPRGQLAFAYGYDSLDQLVSETNPAGDSWSYEHNGFGETTTETAPHRGGAGAAELYQSSFTYTDAGELETITRNVGEPEGSTATQTLNWTFEYDEDGNRNLVTAPGSPAPIVTKTDYDGRGLPWRTTVSGGGQSGPEQTVITEYDANGALRRTVNPAGVEGGLPKATDDGTDEAANLEAAAADATVLRRNSDDQIVEERLPWRGDDDDKRYHREWSRDDLGRVKAIDMPNLVSGSDPVWKINYDYNDAGWIASRTDQHRANTGAGDPLWRYSYDQQGHQTMWRSENNANDDGREIRFNYWPNGLLRERAAVKIVRDGPEDETPEESERSYEYFYNPNRSLVAMSDIDPDAVRPGGTQRVTELRRDDAERETQVREEWGNGLDVQLDYYDQSGELHRRHTDGKFAADGVYSGANAKTTSFEYDSLGRELRMTVDASSGADRMTATSWYDGSAMRERTKPNGTRDEWRWNVLGQVTRHDRFRDGASAAAESQTYAYDPNGNRTRDERGEHLFNARDHLIRWTRPADGGGRSDRDGWVTDYTVDGTGQITLKNEFDPTPDPGDSGEHVRTELTYDGGERLEQTKTVDTTQEATVTTFSTYRYDDAGNVQRIYQKVDTGSDVPVQPPAVDRTALLPSECEQADDNPSPLTTRYCYDEFNRQVFAAGGGVTEPAYVAYDGLDRRDYRQTKTSSGSSTQTREYNYIGSSELLASETKVGEGASQRRSYDYDSRGDRVGLQIDAGGTSNYRAYAKDANGSITGLEDGSGSIAANDRYHYDPYGDRDYKPAEVSVPEGTEPPPGDPDEGLSAEAKDNPFRFEGFYYDSGVKTYDMHARAYRPEVGRFLSRDQYASAIGDLALQADPLTQNRYAFGGGNPITNVEFDGHKYPIAGGGSGSPTTPDGTPTPAVTGGGPTGNGCAGPCGAPPPPAAPAQLDARVIVVSRAAETLRDTISFEEGPSVAAAAKGAFDYVAKPIENAAEFIGDCSPFLNGPETTLSGDCFAGAPQAVADAATVLPSGRGVSAAANSVGSGVKGLLSRIGERSFAAKGLTAAERVAGSADDVARSAAGPYSSASGGLSRAGQSLSKHQHRGGPFPQASGSPATISGQAQDIVEEVLTNPASDFTTRQTGRFGEVVDVQIPGGPGVRYSERDGFLHFLEP